ncbi:unnamed protein product, partial [Mesorhabditis spiculigera]
MVHDISYDAATNLVKKEPRVAPQSSSDEEDIQCDPATLFRSLESFMDEDLPLQGVPLTVGEFIHGRMEARAERRAATVRNVPYLHNTRARLVDTPPPNPEPEGFRSIYAAPPGFAPSVPISRPLEARSLPPPIHAYRARSPPSYARYQPPVPVSDGVRCRSPFRVSDALRTPPGPPYRRYSPHPPSIDGIQCPVSPVEGRIRPYSPPPRPPSTSCQAGDLHHPRQCDPP